MVSHVINAPKRLYIAFDSLLDDKGKPRNIHATKSAGYTRHLLEDINLIYVAMTRAKNHLYLAKNGWKYYLALGGSEESIKLDTFQPSELDAMRALHEQEWVALEEKSTTLQVLAINEIPMPRGPADNMFATHDGLSMEEVKCVMFKSFLRYHEDKFMAKYGHAIQDASAAKEKLVHVFSVAKRSWDEFRESVIDTGDISEPFAKRPRQ